MTSSQNVQEAQKTCLNQDAQGQGQAPIKRIYQAVTVLDTGCHFGPSQMYFTLPAPVYPCLRIPMVKWLHLRISGPCPHTSVQAGRPWL